MGDKTNEGNDDTSESKDAGANVKEETPAENSDSAAELVQHHVEAEPKRETNGDPGEGDEDAPTLAEAKQNGDAKLMKELDDEAPKTFPQVVCELCAPADGCVESSVVLVLAHRTKFHVCSSLLPADGYFDERRSL